MQIKKKSGMSLIETILYLGLVVFVLGALFAFGWNIMGLSLKTQIAQETSQTAWLLAERLAYEIRRADSVDRDNSVFGNTPAKVTLRIGEDTVVISDIGNQITIKRGSADSALLHSQDIQIKNFIFTEQVSATDETQYVGFSFEVEAAYPGSNERSEYQYLLPIRAGSALRTTH